MLQGLFRRAERSIDSAVTRLLERVVATVPLIVAAGFAAAALTVKLVELYGSVAGYSLMAVLFAVIGLVAMAMTGNGNRSEASSAEGETQASTASDQAATDENASDAGLSPEMMSLLSSAAPVALPGIARGVGRNLPLILVLAVILFVISRFAATSDDNVETATDEADVDAAAAQQPAA